MILCKCLFCLRQGFDVYVYIQLIFLLFCCVCFLDGIDMFLLIVVLYFFYFFLSFILLLYFDGLIDMQWICKYQDFVFSVLLCFYIFIFDLIFVMFNDNKIKMDVNNIRVFFSQFGYKMCLVVVFLSDKIFVLGDYVQD